MYTQGGVSLSASGIILLYFINKSSANSQATTASQQQCYSARVRTSARALERRLRYLMGAINVPRCFNKRIKHRWEWEQCERAIWISELHIHLYTYIYSCLHCCLYTHIYFYMRLCRRPLATTCWMASDRHVRAANDATFYGIPLPIIMLLFSLLLLLLYLYTCRNKAVLAVYFYTNTSLAASLYNYSVCSR